MKKHVKISILIAADLLIVFLSLILAYAMRFDNISAFFTMSNYQLLIFTMFAASALISNIFTGCYDKAWRFASIHEAVRLALATFLNLNINVTVFYILAFFGVSFRLNINMHFSIMLFSVIIQFLFMTAMRFIFRIKSIMIEVIYEPSLENGRKNVVIYGDIENSTPILERKRNRDKSKKIIAIIEKLDYKGVKSHIAGAGIYGGGIDFLVEYINKYNIHEVIVTKKTVTNEEIREIYYLCKAKGIALKIFSGVEDYKSNKLKINDVRIEDLLGRTPTRLDLDQIKNFINNKVILVTGGAGSIGTELCRQCLECNCKLLIIFDWNENGLFEIDSELREKYNTKRYRLILGSVRETSRLEEIFDIYRPEVVFHAAAHKHVPMMELNPNEAIKNNVFGTLNVAQTAIKFNSRKFILISTDKAVNPTNVMGTTKRIAEMVIQNLDRNAEHTILSAVRFGNVLGSCGSVIPTFKKQILNGGPVTVTHPDIKRYFMTIPEAVQLVMRAGSMAKGGEVFVLDMGEPVKIIDLAQEMIRMSGFEPYTDIDIKIIGLRPGEKMFEELKLNSESVTRTANNKIYICKPTEIDDKLHIKLRHLKELAERSEEFNYIEELKNIVSEFSTSDCQETVKIEKEMQLI